MTATDDLLAVSTVLSLPEAAPEFRLTVQVCLAQSPALPRAALLIHRHPLVDVEELLISRDGEPLVVRATGPRRLVADPSQVLLVLTVRGVGAWAVHPEETRPSLPPAPGSGLLPVPGEIELRRESLEDDEEQDETADCAPPSWYTQDSPQQPAFGSSEPAASPSASPPQAPIPPGFPIPPQSYISWGSDDDELDVPDFLKSDQYPEPPQPSGPSVPLSDTSRHVVSTGFAAKDAPSAPLPADRTLPARRACLFWLEVGPPVAESIERTPAPLPPVVRPGDAVTAILTATGGGAEVLSSPRVEFILGPDGSLPRRIWFEVHTGAPGTALWSCRLYWRGTLVQARQVRAAVTDRPEPRFGAVVSVLDYDLADPAHPARLTSVPQHQCSLAVAAGPEATHSLAVYLGDGSQSLYAEAAFDDGDISAQINSARAALRRVAWGTAEQWTEADPYRYEHPAALDQLGDDLTRLAVSGAMLYYHLTAELARAVGRTVQDMRGLMGAALRAPGAVQLALGRSARHVLPVALVYDLPLDTQAARLSLCPDFAEAYRSGMAEDAPCFQGRCAQSGLRLLDMVCPGGFWGLRHQIGLPLPAPGRGPAAGLREPSEPLRLCAGVHQGFATAAGHLRAVQTIRPDMEFLAEPDRISLLNRVRSAPEPHLLYFYCHGGLTLQRTPYLQFGARGEDTLTPDNLFNYELRWDRTRPLVFLNGCRTTEVQPEQLMSFAEAFVTDAGGSGLIGTEITVFEPLASRFAEEFLRRFLAEQRPAGEALLLARRRLLAEGNPLGLAYIPFMLPNLALDRVA
ncbi:C25 family cysteine peptidase [Streptomyces sp. NPDC054933]